MSDPFAQGQFDLQARSRGIATTDSHELAILSTSQSKILEQKVMVGKVIDTCQSRLLSWSISANPLLQSAKEASTPARTCLNHPNGCPVPGSAQSQIANTAAAQPQPDPQAAASSAVQAQPQASNTAATQTQPTAAAAQASAAGGQAVAQQAAKAATSAAPAPVSRTEHLQARGDRQKQLNDQYLALQAQQAQGEAGQQGQNTKQQTAASSSKDDGELPCALFNPVTECVCILMSFVAV